MNDVSMILSFKYIYSITQSMMCSPLGFFSKFSNHCSSEKKQVKSERHNCESDQYEAWYTLIIFKVWTLFIGVSLSCNVHATICVLYSATRVRRIKYLVYVC